MEKRITKVNLKGKEVKMMKKIFFAMALVLVTVLAAGTAHAVPTAYAISYDFLFDGFVNIVGGTGVPGTDTSKAEATLNGSGFSVSTTGISGTAPAIVSLGTPTQVAGDFTGIGIQPTNYSVGSAQVVSNQNTLLPPPGDPGDTYIIALNKAESNVVSGTGAAGGNNSSPSLVTMTVELPEGGTIEFSGNAAPYLAVFLSADAAPLVSLATANLEATIEIKDDATGQTVFQWAPDGALGGITGGTELSDPESLQKTLSQLIPGSAIYDPFGIGLAGVGDFNVANFGFYNAITDPLAPGVYTLTLAMEEATSVIVEGVPEPGTFLLVGLGLLGLGAISRRRRSKTS
jgi:hypothetical protein